MLEGPRRSVFFFFCVYPFVFEDSPTNQKVKSSIDAAQLREALVTGHYTYPLSIKHGIDLKEVDDLF